MEKILLERAGNACELCRSPKNLTVYQIPSVGDSDKSQSLGQCLVACDTCLAQLEGKSPMDEKHWSCLAETIWSEVDAAKVIAWRLLTHFKGASWAQELLEQLYLDEPLLQWAQSVPLDVHSGADATVTKDNFGNILSDGDSVTLIKDLDVKGAGFTAKRGTLVKNITLTNDPGLIEGKVNGVGIVLVTKFLKKA